MMKLKHGFMRRFGQVTMLSLLLIGVEARVEAQVKSIGIERSGLMPFLPEPYMMRDWAQVARDYDELVFDFERHGEYLPLIWRDKSRINSDQDGFGLPSYVGDTRMTGGDSRHEAINCVAAVISASLVGIDKSHQKGENWVAMCEDYYVERQEQGIYLNTSEAVSGGSFWYEILPNVLMFQLTYLYPDEGDLKGKMYRAADRWREACEVLTKKTPGEGWPNFNYTAFNFKLMQPVDNGIWIEPDAAAGVAWLEYMAWKKFGDKKFLEAAEGCLRFLEARKANPLYECLMPLGAYTAARINAEMGRQYDVEKLVNWCFDASDARHGWGVIADRWGDYDCHGLCGSLTDGGGYGFAMNTFNMMGALVPLVRYEPRLAADMGRWVLNAANSARLFYANGLPPEHQTSYEWASQYDKAFCLTYEGLRRQWKGTSPFTMGDPLVHGWARTDFALYGSSYAGIPGAIIQKTQDERLLLLDCGKTDYFQDKAYPTLLVYNPYQEKKTVRINLGKMPVGVYDLVSHRVLMQKASAFQDFELEGRIARILISYPADKPLHYDQHRTVVDGVVIDYDNGRVASAVSKPILESAGISLKDDQSRKVRAPRMTIHIDGEVQDWDDFKGDAVELHTHGRGDMRCRVRWAWDEAYFYMLAEEQPGDTTRDEPNEASDYAAAPWNYDGLALFIDIDNSNDREVVGDINPWFAFSTLKRSGLYASQSHRPVALSPEQLKHSGVVSLSQENHLRVIEAKLSWSDIQEQVGSNRQPDGGLTQAIRPGFRFGCDPLLMDDNWRHQSFIGGEKKPSGYDRNSLDIILTIKED